MFAGVDPGFPVRGGGRTYKNCAERREARTFLGYFVWKIAILQQKIVFFPILGTPLPWIRPCKCTFQIASRTSRGSRTGGSTAKGTKGVEQGAQLQKAPRDDAYRHADDKNNIYVRHKK